MLAGENERGPRSDAMHATYGSARRGRQRMHVSSTPSSPTGGTCQAGLSGCGSNLVAVEALDCIHLTVRSFLVRYSHSWWLQLLGVCVNPSCCQVWMTDEPGCGRVNTVLNQNASLYHIPMYRFIDVVAVLVYFLGFFMLAFFYFHMVIQPAIFIKGEVLLVLPPPSFIFWHFIFLLEGSRYLVLTSTCSPPFHAAFWDTSPVLKSCGTIHKTV